MPNITLYDKPNADIIIVGAGPAGISTALHLAILAPELVSRTLILEKARHPRPKLCGGGILPDAEVVLRQLGLDITEIPFAEVDWAHFEYEGRGFKFRPDPEQPSAFRVIRRQEFDAWLVSKARVRGFLIHENTTVKNITPTESDVVVTTDRGEYRAMVVVGADGSKSVVRRAIIPHENLHVARLLEVITESIPEKSFHKQSDSYFDFMVLPFGIKGYVWDFPAVENGKPVRVRGVYDSNVFFSKNDISLRAALDREFGRHGLQLSSYELEGHPIRWFDSKCIFSSHRVLLAGDAAGADALFGEGISIALGYGRLTAQALRDSFARQDFFFREYRRDILRSEMGKSLRRRTWWARFFYRLRWHFFQRLAWNQLSPLIVWIMRNFLIGWAQRQERKSKGRMEL